MKVLILLLLISCRGYSQYSFKLKEHKVSMGFTVMQGLADGFRDASMFGRVKWGRWYNESLDSWKMKYKNEDYTQGALYPGSTSLFVGISDAPHGANSVSHFSGEMAKVYMPNMTGATFWQKFKTVLIYSAVRSIPHNIVNDIIFKRK